MRKLFALLFVLGLVTMTAQASFAQAEEGQENTEMEASTDEAMETVDSTMEDTATDTTAAMEEEPAAEEMAVDATEEVEEEQGGFQVLKEKFIEGGYEFMSLVLIALILGLAFCIERIITLNIASVNTDKLLGKIDDRLRADDLEGAMEVCKSTQGPTASILYEGLKNAGNGPEAVEKAIVAYGGVQMGLLEKGLIWISLFIAVAPMLGFMGTVIGMIGAFDDIEAAGDISPTVVAGGIKVALLTTVFGLIVAIILQIFYNYIVSKVDGIVNKMEDASISLVDIMVENGVFKK
jgi:biopolymer transport protein ExbB